MLSCSCTMIVFFSLNNTSIGKIMFRYSKYFITGKLQDFRLRIMANIPAFQLSGDMHYQDLDKCIKHE